MLKANRLTAVVVANAILAVAPLTWIFITINMSTLPILWILYSLPLGGFLLLALWTGLGNARAYWRTAALVAGCVYLAIWPTIAEYYVAGGTTPGFGANVLPLLVIGIVLSAMLAALRPWFHLSKVDYIDPIKPPKRMQFSIFHLLVLMSVVALILSLSRAARGGAEQADDFRSWEWWAAGALMAVTFFTNAACAAFAALGTTAVTRKCAIVVFVATLLGVAIAFSLKQDEQSGWLFAGGVLTMVIPTVIVLVSLLWLRPTGYRLLRKHAYS